MSADQNNAVAAVVDRPEVIGFEAGSAAGFGSEVLGTRGAEMAALVRMELPIRAGITVPVGAAERLTDESFAADAISTLTLGRQAHLFRLAVSAPVAVAGLPPEMLFLGLSLANFEVYAAQFGRPTELSAGWASAIRAVAEHGLSVPTAAISGVVMDVPDPIAQVPALLELCAAQGRAPYPSGAAEQLALAARAMLARWASPRAQRARRAQGVASDLGLALHLEEQPIHSWEQTGRGVAVSRDSETGHFAPHGHFRPGFAAAARDGGQPLTALPVGRDELIAAVRALETMSRTAVEVDFEYSPEGVRLIGFQADRRPSARTTVALSAELAEQGVIDRAAAVAAISPDAVSELLHARFRLTGSERLLVRGLPASPGAAVGQVALSSEHAVELAETGAPVILVASETTPADLTGMLAAQAIVTSRGGSASHAAVVARGIGRPAVCGASELTIVQATGEVRAGQWSVREGDTISVDGWTGAVYEGSIPIRQSEPTPELRTILGWADDVRRLGVRANADTGPQTEVALSLGAEGIGLCRTEHQFLGDRLPLIQHVLLASDSDTEQAALVALAAAQREDFRALLRAVGDRPVTVRLLDAPLHEFLPAHQLEHASQADAELARSLREENPMLGVRGIRLAVLHEGLYPAQVQALFMAWLDVEAEGIRPQLEVMVPLVSMVAELRFAATLIRREAAIIAERTGVTVPYRVGTMVETPRAALLAGQLVAEAEFLSFGTNDLSQLTFGLSRDDVERRMMAPYLEQGMLTASPFVSLDPDGVGELISLAVTRARAARPDVKLGLCGEHGADPASIALCDRLGLDYVSCSPQRIPIARLAAAHAAMGR